jgi:transcriptional regulator with XRE-family HTH domain
MTRRRNATTAATPPRVSRCAAMNRTCRPTGTAVAYPFGWRFRNRWVVLRRRAMHEYRRWVEHLYRLRRARRWSQEEVSRRVFISRAQYGLIERGLSSVSLAQLFSIAAAFGISIRKLLTVPRGTPAPRFRRASRHARHEGQCQPPGRRRGTKVLGCSCGGRVVAEPGKERTCSYCHRVHIFPNTLKATGQ